MSTTVKPRGMIHRFERRFGIAVAILVHFAGTGSSADQPPLATGEPSAYAAVGFAVGEKLHLGELQWSEAQFEAFVAGLRQHFEGGNAIVVDATAQPVYVAINEAIQRAQGRPAPRSADDPLQLLVRQLGLEPTDRGVFVRILRGGSGARPTPADTVVISVSARAVDTGADVAALTVENLRIKVADLMPGLAYGAQLLALEGHAVLLVPPELSFGAGNWPAGVPRGSPLLFLVQLHDVVAADSGPAP